MSSLSPGTYTRSEDGAEMVAIAPHVFVNAELVKKLKIAVRRVRKS